MNQTATHVDGVQVIERQPAEGPHPHPGKNGMLVPFTGVNQVLLADGRVIYECDHPACTPYRNVKMQSVVSHMSKHKDHGPRYPEDTLRRVIHEVRRQAQVSHSGKCQRAADALNAAGITTLGGEPWRASQVSALFGSYKNAFPRKSSPRRQSPAHGGPVQVLTSRGRGSVAYSDASIAQAVEAVRRARAGGARNVYAQVAAELQSRGVPTATGAPWNRVMVRHVWSVYGNRHKRTSEVPAAQHSGDISTTAAELVRRVDVLAEDLARVSRDIVDYAAQVAATVAAAQAPAADYAELRDKAARYDALQGLFTR